MMVHNPELVKQLLGESVAELFDGIIDIEPSKNEMFGNLKVGDKLAFTFKNAQPTVQRQFVITSK